MSYRSSTIGGMKPLTPPQPVIPAREMTEAERRAQERADYNKRMLYSRMSRGQRRRSHGDDAF